MHVTATLIDSSGDVSVAVTSTCGERLSFAGCDEDHPCYVIRLWFKSVMSASTLSTASRCCLRSE